MFGFSGVSSDFRDLLASQDPHVRFALEVFCCQTVRHMGSLVAKSVELTALFLPGASGKMPLVSAQRNNNAYRRDNEIIWFDWELRRTYADIHRIVRMMVAF